MSVPTITLNNGDKVPVVGLGTWKAEPGEAYQVVKDAIDLGYRNFDCAWIYGNEQEIGAGIRDKIKEGVVKREDLFITTKLWNTCHEPEDVLPAIKKSLENFGLDYVDLYLMHWPLAFKKQSAMNPKEEHFEAGNYMPGSENVIDLDFVATWKAMEQCQDLGLTRSLGLSNFNSKQIKRILNEGRIRPVMNQVECHPYLNQSKLIEFCTKNSIVVTGYAPFVSPGRPWATEGDPSILKHPVIVELSKSLGKTPGQIVLKWLVNRNVIVIPKSSNKKRLADNINIFDFELDPKAVRDIDALNTNERIFGIEWVKGKPNFPFEEEF